MRNICFRFQSFPHEWFFQSLSRSFKFGPNLRPVMMYCSDYLSFNILFTWLLQSINVLMRRVQNVQNAYSSVISEKQGIDESYSTAHTRRFNRHIQTASTACWLMVGDEFLHQCTAYFHHVSSLRFRIRSFTRCSIRFFLLAASSCLPYAITSSSTLGVWQNFIPGRPKVRTLILNSHLVSTRTFKRFEIILDYIKQIRFARRLQSFIEWMVYSPKPINFLCIYLQCKWVDLLWGAKALLHHCFIVCWYYGIIVFVKDLLYYLFDEIRHTWQSWIMRVWIISTAFHTSLSTSLFQQDLN